MQFSAVVAALLLSSVVARDPAVLPGGADCPTTCYGMTCLSSAALYAGLAGSAGCEEVESWGCDCAGCDCDDVLDPAEVPEACPSTYKDTLSCDEMAYFGFSCHYMETRRGADCSGCLCEEAVLDYDKGDGSCPVTCVGLNCDEKIPIYAYSCEAMETLDWMMGCDCSGCECDSSTTPDGLGADHPAYAYHGMDCNGNGYWGADGVLANDTCDEEVGSFTHMFGSPDSGYAEQTWFTCLSCEEMDCDMGDCGEEACGRDGSTCALPLAELCADEDSVVTPTQFGRAIYCPEGWDATEEATSQATEAATEAVVAADEDGSLALTTTAIFAIALLF